MRVGCNFASSVSITCIIYFLICHFRSLGIGIGTVFMYSALLLTLIVLKIKSPSNAVQDDESKTVKTSTNVLIVCLILLLCICLSSLVYFKGDQTFVFIIVYNVYEIIIGIFVPLKLIFGLPNLNQFAIDRIQQYNITPFLQFKTKIGNVALSRNEINVANPP